MDGHSSVGLPSGSLITIGGWTLVNGQGTRLAQVWLLKQNVWSQLMSLNEVRFIKKLFMCEKCASWDFLRKMRLALIEQNTKFSFSSELFLARFFLVGDFPRIERLRLPWFCRLLSSSDPATRLRWRRRYLDKDSWTSSKVALLSNSVSHT